MFPKRLENKPESTQQIFIRTRIQAKVNDTEKCNVLRKYKNQQILIHK